MPRQHGRGLGGHRPPSGPLAPWPPGPVAPWAALDRPLARREVRWPLGPLAPRPLGPSAPWPPGPLAPWPRGPLAPWAPSAVFWPVARCRRRCWTRDASWCQATYADERAPRAVGAP